MKRCFHANNNVIETRQELYMATNTEACHMYIFRSPLNFYVIREKISWSKPFYRFIKSVYASNVRQQIILKKQRKISKSNSFCVCVRALERFHRLINRKGSIDFHWDPFMIKESSLFYFIFFVSGRGNNQAIRINIPRVNVFRCVCTCQCVFPNGAVWK